VKNKNNKGFFLSETMVVIAIVAIVLLSVFKIFSSVYSKYKESENYNTINATNTAVQLKKYYQSVGLDYTTLLGGNYYVELTNSATYDSEHYDNLKATLKVDKVYLVNMAQVYTGTNINVFNTSLRQYLKTLQNGDATISLITISDGSEYGSVSVVTTATVTLNGDSNNEFETVVPVTGTFVDPGYINWSGNPPTTTWEPTLDTSKEGTYYLKYSFDGYILRRRVTVAKIQYFYNFTGAAQTFTVPYTGYYKIELWGSQGTAYGGYTYGTIYLAVAETLYVYVGERNTVVASTSFNGGTATGGGTPGGGATDIRLVSGAWNEITSLRSRIMVASGGGSGQYLGSGGGLVGLNGTTATGGTQIAGGTQESTYGNGSFGIGGGGCGGGGGYYGGGGGTCANGGGGGSSFISGFAGSNAVTSSSSTVATNNTKHYSGKYFINANTLVGQNIGPGSAKIAFLGTVAPARVKTTLNNVRYVKDCINGSSANTANHWVEIQAISNGINVAYGKTSTGTAAENVTYPYSRITDGDISYANYSKTEATGLQCITVDLGSAYNLDEIVVWHYWLAGRIYNNNTTSVSSDNTNWTTVISNTQIETSQGKRVNVWN